MNFAAVPGEHRVIPAAVLVDGAGVRGDEHWQGAVGEAAQRCIREGGVQDLVAVTAAERHVAGASVDEGRIVARRYGAYESRWRRGGLAGYRCGPCRVRWSTRGTKQSEMKLPMGGVAVGGRVARAVVDVSEAVAGGESAHKRRQRRVMWSGHRLRHGARGSSASSGREARVRDATVFVDNGGWLVNVDRSRAVGNSAGRRVLERGVQQLVAPAAADSQGAGLIVDVGGFVARLDCAEALGRRW